MTNRSFPNDIFFDAVLESIAAGKEVRIRSKGNSMAPFIRNGIDDIVLRSPTKETIRRGNIVLALIGNRYIVHRVEKISQNTITLRGDGNISLREQCEREHILAEVVAIIRDNRRIENHDRQWILARSLWPSTPLLRRIVLAIRHRVFKTNSQSTSSPHNI